LAVHPGTAQEACMPSLLICTSPLPDAVAQRAHTEFGAVLSQTGGMNAADLLQALQAHPKARAVMVSGGFKVPAALVAQLPPTLQLLATCSVGLDHIDLVAAAQRGLPVSNTPDVLTDATADMALLLMLGAARRMREYLRIMDAGWRHRYGLGEMLGTDLRGKTLGILGMGRIGQAVAQRARAFGLRIAYHNTRRLPPALEGDATYAASLEALLPISNVLSLHAPGGGALNAVINRHTLGLLPRGAILVNTARGSLVNEDDLIEALQSGQLAAAGLDVFQGEPAFDLRLRDLPNVFLAPHMGSATVDTRNAMGWRALDNVADVLAGRPPRDPA
jgi:lactate dehydrogenase-like 2-hydroxyacid dehydrogenase